MMRLILLLATLAAALPAQVAKTAATISLPSPRLPRAALTVFESHFDRMLAGIGTLNEPIDPLGSTRGAYIEGFGVVVSTELALMVAPAISPFRQTITPDMVAHVYKRKTERLPLLLTRMRDMMKVLATTLTQIPEDQQIVLIVRLDYLSWENTAKLPAQVMMRADRKSVLAGEFKEESQ